MEPEDAPSSLMPVERAAPWLVLAAGLSTMVMCLTFATRIDDAGILLWVVGIPVSGASLAAFFFAHRRASLAGGSLFLATLVQAWLGFLLVTELEGAVAASFVSTFAYAVTAPALIMAWSFGKRRERDAGDTMLLWGGAWSAALHLVYVVALWGHSEKLATWLAVTGLLASVLLSAAAATRAQNRRRFVELAAKGRMPGYRVRAQPTLEELRQLAPLFALGGASSGVLERMTVSVDGSAYRGGLIATPVALVPSRG